MSNESERIDLTQFEGHTEGNWCISDDGNGLIKTDEFWIRLFEPYCDDGITEDEDTINKELMVSAPDLIAELKRCYEELDRPKVTIDDWDKEGLCVTVYLEGTEYVGIVREYDASEWGY